MIINRNIARGCKYNFNMKLMADYSIDDWRAIHQYQFDSSHNNPNECTLCSMTMLLNLGGQLAGNDLDIQAVFLGKELDLIPFRHPRFPAWFPGPGGATHPRAALKGIQQKIRSLRRAGNKFPLWPSLRKEQSLIKLESEIKASHPSLIYGVGKSGIPHVVIPIARKAKVWQILDPGFPSNRNPRTWSDKQLLQWWVGFGLFYTAGTMISLIPEAA